MGIETGLMTGDVSKNFHGLKPVAFAATGFACPPSADNFIYGLKPVELGRNIKKVNNNQVKGIQSFKEIIKKVDISKGVLLDIVRQKRPFYVTIRPTEQDLRAWQ